MICNFKAQNRNEKSPQSIIRVTYLLLSAHLQVTTLQHSFKNGTYLVSCYWKEAHPVHFSILFSALIQMTKHVITLYFPPEASVHISYIPVMNEWLHCCFSNNFLDTYFSDGRFITVVLFLTQRFNVKMLHLYWKEQRCLKENLFLWFVW